jgi:hypothetical protein
LLPSVFVALLLYLAPAIIALGQEVAEFWVVYIVNLFLGGRS